MEIKGEDFLVTFNEPKAAVEFFGTIRLRDSSDYKAISDLLDAACRRVTGRVAHGLPQPPVPEQRRDQHDQQVRDRRPRAWSGSC